MLQTSCGWEEEGGRLLQTSCGWEMGGGLVCCILIRPHELKASKTYRISIEEILRCLTAFPLQQRRFVQIGVKTFARWWTDITGSLQQSNPPASSLPTLLLLPPTPPSHCSLLLLPPPPPSLPSFSSSSSFLLLPPPFHFSIFPFFHRFGK